MNMKTDWLMFRDEATIKEWELETGRMLADVLHFSNPFKISLLVPDEAKAAEAWNNNGDLKGTIRIAHPDFPYFDIALEPFLPFDGVFISEREDGLRPLPIVWSSWLCEAPGVRIVKPTSQKMRDKKMRELRVGLSGGNYVRILLGKKVPEDLKKRNVELWQIDAARLKYPDWLLACASKPKVKWGKVLENAPLDKIGESDQDDLGSRILMTFPIWLKYRVCKIMLSILPKGILREMYRPEKNDDECGICRLQIIDSIAIVAQNKKLLDRISARLVPLAVRKPKKKEQSRAVDGFVFVEPNNPVDLAARLTRVKRLQMSRHAMEEIPAEFRQNHPSFMGRLCPVESPESELVGLSLQLVQGARVDKDGFIIKAGEEASATMGYRANLGWGAGLIPLFQHNDGTRNMMGAKNLRQVLPPVEGREAPAIKSGGETDILKFTERLTRIGVCPDAADENGEMALGRDLLVAYMPWYGWNMEDAIVISKRVVDEHLFDVAVTKRVKKHVRPGWHPQGEFKSIIDISKVLGDAKPSEVSSVSEEGLATKGETLKTGDVIVRLVSSTGQHVNEIRYKDASPAVVKEIKFGQKQKWMSGTLEYVLEKHIPLGLGDKLMGRHGNKGVIGRIEEIDKMPCLPNDERLPKDFRGRKIDILLNPHGVISRMNIGQLLETHLGWLAHAGKCSMGDLMTDGCQAAEIGIPAVGVIDHDKVQNQLEKTGLDRQGRIQLVLPNGDLTKSPVVVGFEHIVRLKHIPELKSQARGGGATCGYDSKTGQAVHGRVRGGGQRVGEMEVWALAGHQAEFNLAEMLGGKADAVWARDWLSGGKIGDAETEEGFPRQMKDWLFAVGIDMSRNEAGKICFSLCTDSDAIRGRVNINDYDFDIDSVVEEMKSNKVDVKCGVSNGDGFWIVAIGEASLAEITKAQGMSAAKLEAKAVMAKLIQAPAETLYSESGPSFMASFTQWSRSNNTDVLLGRLEIAKTFVDGNTAHAVAVIRQKSNRHEVVSGEGVSKVQTASFACGRKNKKGECGYVFPLERLCASEKGRLRLGDVLTHIGYKIVGPMSGTRGGYTAMLETLDGGSPDGQLKIVFDDYEKGKDWLKFHVRPANGEDRPSKWPQGLNDIFAYGRFAANNAERKNGVSVGKNVSAEYLKECVVTGKGQHTIIDFNVTCPDHPTIPLSQVPPFGEAIRLETGGLFDEQAFGSLKNIFVHARDEQWGYINLPIPVKFPFQTFIKERDAWNRLSDGNKAKEVKNFFTENGISQIPECELNVIPVLPSRYRLPLIDVGTDDKLVTDGYRPLLEACQNYQRLKSTNNTETAGNANLLKYAKKEIANAVEGLFFLLVDRLKGKFGILRRNGLGRRVDRSSRLVITPNPKLEWNQAAVPPSVLWELMGDKVLPWMKENGLGKDDWGSLEDMISGRIKLAEIAEGWSWLRSEKDAKVLDVVAENLRKYLDKHPDTLVLLNRQPSLHKDSFQAFHPIVLDPKDGEIFQLSPLCCKGLGADFDGDEMVGHYPVSDAAQKEVANMLPDNNLLSSATGTSLAHFDQDFVMGNYWMSEFPDLLQRLKALLPSDCCRSEKFVPRQGERSDKKLGEALLNHVCFAHPDEAVRVVSQWLRLALEACSRMGVSFGFYDLLEMTQKVEKNCKAAERTNEAVQKVITDELEGFLRDADNAAAGLHVAGMAISGARGKKQIRQLIGVRGKLDPGTLGYEMSKADQDNRFWFNIPLTKGMDWDMAFYASMNARSSMCDKKLGTGQAGALTRKLVFALWPFKIVTDDCGSKATDRSVITCKAHGGFCAKCYGTLPNGKLPQVGYPAGLIAAQSIGERGTQLSMQSFHTGSRAFDMRTVREILSGKQIDYFDNIGKASEFVKRFKFAKPKENTAKPEPTAYSDILDLHFKVLWRALFDVQEHSLDEVIGGHDVKHSLDEVIGGHDVITNLSYSKQARGLLLAAIKGEVVDVGASPVVEVLFNNFATKKA